LRVPDYTFDLRRWRDWRRQRDAVQRDAVQRDDG
jgi:hypothetical protein